MWLNQLKIAIIEQNIDELNDLMQNIPELKKEIDVDSAICLLKEATILVSSLRDDIKSSMLQMQKTINFLKATESQKSSKFDIKL